MSNKQISKPVSLAAGAIFAASIVAAPTVQADVNPFAITALSSGYMVADKGAEGQCGANKRVTEAECGANKAANKVNEAECGANKPAKKVNEAECGANKPVKSKPVVEAKCGEAKCGANK
jgi:uncharacterized low-complexity protein